ncbi:MAG TPA: hypothetical protein VHN74_09925 [Candidatus Angelobacter sp.]|nr:hypothetical protein [Candidatus Angelobacter sp.]
MVRRLIRLSLVSLLLSLVSGIVHAQQNPERLILKDGSFQSVTKYEVNGNRVRYFSADRYSWEEIPRDLVDWPATEKFNKERQSQREEEVTKAGAPEPGDAPEPPMVAPGLYLPDGGGVFVLDNFQGQPQLVELSQNDSALNKHMGKNIMRAAINPLSLSSKQTIELKGSRSATQSHLTQPAFYVNVESADAQPTAASSPAKDKPAANNQAAAPAEQQRFGIVRMEKKKDVRVVGDLNIAMTGKVSQKQNWVKTTSEPAGAGWMKLTPVEPLTPGEYAIVELLEKGQINLFVWDFGVDPGAPANPHAWSAHKSGSGADDRPTLEKRPH